MRPGGVTMTSTTPAMIFVVDPNVGDYAALTRLVANGTRTLRFLLTGHDALRIAASGPPDLWIINVRLPDMSGFHLVEMLEAHDGCRIFMVTDAYRAEDEIRALSLGVALYLCKPLEATYLRQWRPVK